MEKINAFEKFNKELNELERMSPEERKIYVENLDENIDPMWEDIFEMGKILNNYEDTMDIQNGYIIPNTLYSIIQLIRIEDKLKDFESLPGYSPNFMALDDGSGYPFLELYHKHKSITVKIYLKPYNSKNFRCRKLKCSINIETTDFSLTMKSNTFLLKLAQDIDSIFKSMNGDTHVISD